MVSIRNSARIHPSCSASQQEIDAFEQKYDIVLPLDLREYFLRLNGIEEDLEDFCFWPIGRVRPVDSKTFKALEAGRYFYFADCLTECNYYAIYLGSDPFFQHRVLIPDSSANRIIAQTFIEFLKVYLRDDPELYII